MYSFTALPSPIYVHTVILTHTTLSFHCVDITVTFFIVVFITILLLDFHYHLPTMDDDDYHTQHHHHPASQPGPSPPCCSLPSLAGRTGQQGRPLHAQPCSLLASSSLTSFPAFLPFLLTSALCLPLFLPYYLLQLACMSCVSSAAPSPFILPSPTTAPALPAAFPYAHYFMPSYLLLLPSALQPQPFHTCAPL